MMMMTLVEVLHQEHQPEVLGMLQVGHQNKMYGLMLILPIHIRPTAEILYYPPTLVLPTSLITQAQEVELE